jgi:hypothetical protein
MTEQEYRRLEIDSYSTLKDFIEDRKKYYKKYVLKETVKEEESSSTIFGNVTDCLQFTPGEFENRFALSVSQVPTGQYGKFVNEMVRITFGCLNERGEVTMRLEDIMEEAYNKCKYDRNGNVVDFKRDGLDVVKQKFLGSDLEIHYRQCREAFGKTIIEASTLENAQRVIAELKSNPVTSAIMNLETSNENVVYNQFPIVGKMDGSMTGRGDYPLKGLIDKLVIDHKEKCIYIYDLKTTWDNEGEFLSNYFKFKYYIQMAVYFYLVVEWKRRQSGLETYTVHYPSFIVADSSNYKNPLIYATTHENFQQGMRGFTIRGKYYPGAIKAITDLMWHKESGIWNISKDNYDAGGIARIQPFQ